MSTAVVRVDQRIHSKLREIAERENRSIGKVVAELVERYEREEFWRQMHAGFADLRRDRKAWQEYQDETALWDSTLSDGLEDEEPYYTPEEEAGILADANRAQNR